MSYDWQSYSAQGSSDCLFSWSIFIKRVLRVVSLMLPVAQVLDAVYLVCSVLAVASSLLLGARLAEFSEFLVSQWTVCRISEVRPLAEAFILCHSVRTERSWEAARCRSR